MAKEDFPKFYNIPTEEVDEGFLKKMREAHKNTTFKPPLRGWKLLLNRLASRISISLLEVWAEKHLQHSSSKQVYSTKGICLLRFGSRSLFSVCYCSDGWAVNILYFSVTLETLPEEV